MHDALDKSHFSNHLAVTVPDLVVSGHDASAEVGSSAVLLCNVVNIPVGTTIDYQWRRADMSPISVPSSALSVLYLTYVGVSDAGVYICEVTVSDSLNNPYVIPQSGSVNVTLTVTGK